MSLIVTTEIYRVYRTGSIELTALRNITTSIREGEFVAVMGPSGSGKSTFMNILGCLDTPTSGRYFLSGDDVGNLDRDQRAQIRNKKIGFVFQGFNLLPRTSATENVELPMLYDGIPSRERRERAAEALDKVGLLGREDAHPGQLSGGQQQRVAIARALVNNAAIILADEPTGNLDTKTSAEVMELFSRLNTENRITIVVVTHEQDIAAYTRRIIRFLDGSIISDEQKVGL